ncbi:hypothetical protein BZA05DRAFT_401096 [Tricharina praecox]|uniref:uncharacterized protein n=1 Tax=Tricharina praecox TaxID=43433 RepID=UPI00222022C7|nr:uncharacterized protein BZA05DRAFT_401096 [Tricharina praecox]KAI5850151.1 hypothetical protein BZA05DRAFT_401096 [Tricharina praecox]
MPNRLGIFMKGYNSLQLLPLSPPTALTASTRCSSHLYPHRLAPAPAAAPTHTRTRAPSQSVHAAPHPRRNSAMKTPTLLSLLSPRRCVAAAKARRRSSKPCKPCNSCVSCVSCVSCPPCPPCPDCKPCNPCNPCQPSKPRNPCKSCDRPCNVRDSGYTVIPEEYVGQAGDVPASWCKCCFECVLMQSIELELRMEDLKLEREGREGREGREDVQTVKRRITEAGWVEVEV